MPLGPSMYARGTISHRTLENNGLCIVFFIWEGVGGGQTKCLMGNSKIDNDVQPHGNKRELNDEGEESNNATKQYRLSKEKIQSCCTCSTDFSAYFLRYFA